MVQLKVADLTGASGQVMGFNSKMVQLKEKLVDYIVENELMFQFQNGTIKRKNLNLKQAILD